MSTLLPILSSSPLDLFTIRNLFSLKADILGNLQISLTNIGLYLIIATFIVFMFYTLATNYEFTTPNGWSLSMESIYATVHSIVTNKNNTNKGQIFFPLISALFIYILINNLVGMVPYNFAATSHFILTFSISFTIVIGVTILGFQIHSLKFFSLLGLRLAANIINKGLAYFFLVYLHIKKNATTFFQRDFLKSKYALALLLILVVLLNNIICYNNSTYCSFALYNWEIVCIIYKVVCFALIVANDIICFFTFLIVLIFSTNFIFVILPYFIIIFISFEINQKKLDTPTVLSATSSCNKVDSVQPSISYIKLNFIFFKFIASGGFLILSDLALVLIYLITYLSNQIIVKRNEIMSFVGHPVMPQIRACIRSFRISEALFFLFFLLWLFQKAFLLITGANGAFLGIDNLNLLELLTLILVVYISSGFMAIYYNSNLSKINWKNKWDPVYFSSIESPNIWPLYTNGALFILVLSGILFLHNITGALIFICASLISLVYSMWSWLRYHASWQYNDTAVNVYYNITGVALLCKHLVINLIYLFLEGGCIFIYEIFNKTFLLKKGGYIYRVYYSALFQGNSEKSASVFVMLIYLIFRLNIFLDYYVLMYNEGSSENLANMSGQPSANNGNNNGNNNNSNPTQTSANPDENNRRRRENVMSLSFMLSNNTTSPVFSSTNIVQNQSNNIITTRELDITNPMFNITGSSTQAVSTSSLSNIDLSAYYRRRNNQINTSIVTDTVNNLSNISAERSVGISGKVAYLEKKGIRYIRIMGDKDGQLIARLKRDDLLFCNLETIRVSGMRGEVHVLNLEGCINVKPYREGYKQGVWIPDIRKPLDALKNYNDGNFKKENGDILIYNWTHKKK